MHIEDELIRHLHEGGVVAYPTSTLPGLGALPNQKGLNALFSIKMRDASKPVSLGVISLEQALDLVIIPSEIIEMERSFPKGSLSFVLPAIEETDPRLGGQWIAVRCFAHPIARMLVSAVGPITATSANEAGQEPAPSAEQAGMVLGLPSFAVLPGDCPGGKGSTFVRYDKEQEKIEVLREGVISNSQISDWLDKK